MRQIDEDFVISKEELKKMQDYLTSIGPRYTGNKAHKDSIEFYAKELEDRGLEVHRDKHAFTKWEAQSWKLMIHNTSKEAEEIETMFYYPYSGCTPEAGVTAEMIHLKGIKPDYKKAAGKIAVIEVNNLTLPSALILKKKQAFPEDTKLPAFIRNTTVSSVLSGPDLKRAEEVGVRGIICIWKNISKEEAESQYLPFTKPLQNCPSLWIDPSRGIKVKEAAEKGLKATIVLKASIEEAESETIYAVLRGMNSKENIIVNSHSDVPNNIEENGSIAVIALADYFSKQPIEKRQCDMVFLIVTGHMQIPQFGINGQATTRWLLNHKDLWDGENDHAKTIAGLTLEHMGALEDSEHGKEDTEIDRELVYTGNNKMDEIYSKAVKDRERIRSITLKPINNLYFGEGQPLFNEGIPTISLIPAPYYLLKEEKMGVSEYVDIDLMYNQIKTFIKITLHINRLNKEEIGRADEYSGVFKFLGKKAH